MGSALAMVDESPRLYSLPSRLPVDVVAPQHATIHADLDRWGRWNRERHNPGTCASMEKLYLRGGRDASAPATAPQPPDPRLLAIDSAWRLMVRRAPKHAQMIYLYYVVREEPKLICRRITLHRLEFPGFIGYARSMVSNILRELDS